MITTPPAIRILGAVEVGGRPVDAEKARIFLLALLLRHNKVVSVERLVDVLWEHGPPRSAIANIRSYAHRLRRLLGHRGALTYRAGGYELAVDPDGCDHERFVRLAAEGRDALRAADACRASRLLAEAASLWRGDQVAAGVRRPGAIEPDLVHLDEERLRVAEDLADSWLRLGEARAAMREVRTVLDVAPLRTRAWELLMRGHHALGEYAGVDEARAAAEKVFLAELGVTSPELTALRAELLRAGDPLVR